MKILTAEQIKELDRYTIEHEPISSLDLMERAATTFYRRLVKLLSADERIFVFCGKGNNGGDGLVISRLLCENNQPCTAVIIEHSDQFSPDAAKNFERLKKRFSKQIVHVRTAADLDNLSIPQGAVIIDALFGTGLSRKAEGLAADAIMAMNRNEKIISVDIPSGLYADKPAEGVAIVRSSLTLTFQLPKLSFLLADNAKYVPEFEILDIGLHERGMDSLDTKYFYITSQFVISLLKKRSKFSHKGNFGHALLFAGSRGKSGAAILSARACMRSGAGLLTVHSTKDTLDSLLLLLPEAMSVQDPNEEQITDSGKVEEYNAIGFGPGVGQHEDTARVLKKILQYAGTNLVIDADGLNILAGNKTWLSFLPPDSILTPHPGEFARLTEKLNDGFDRLATLREFCMKHHCITVLKGAHSAIGMPDGNIVFNSSGNAGLAKAGSGDGLTGIILGLLARGYNPPQATIIGTFVHGYAADLLLKKKSMESLLITDVIEELPKAFRKLEEVKDKSL